MSANSPLDANELADAVDQLPPVSSILRRLLAVLRDPNSEVSDIAQLVRVDTALATQLLKLANSPHFALAERVTTIEQAVQHIGLNEVTRMASTLGGRQLLSRALGRYHIPASLLWNHTLAVSVSAEVVAEHVFADPGPAYLAGLLHTVGLVALDILADTRALPARPFTLQISDWEMQNFGMTNAQVAAQVLTQWNFPADIVAAVGGRLSAPSPETVSSLGGILFIASAVAERIPAGLPVEKGIFTLPSEQLALLNLTDGRFSDLVLESAQRISRLSAMLKLT